MKGAAVLKRIRKPLVSLLLAAVLACALFALSSAAGLFGDIDGDGGVTYRLPKFLFSARFRVPLSEEKRRELSDRARRVKPHLSHAKPQAFDKDTTGVDS